MISADTLEGSVIAFSLPEMLSENLPGASRDEIVGLVQEFADRFPGQFGCTDLVVHVIETTNEKPINLPPYQASPAKQAVIEQQIEKMVKDDVIEPCSSPWEFPVVIVKKPDGEPRFYVDY